MTVRRPRRRVDDGQHALVEGFPHRMFGIDEQIDEDLDHLVEIGGGLGQPVVEIELDL